MPVKVFNLEEANRLIPEVEQAIRWLQERVREVIQTQDAISVLDLLGAGEKTNPEHRALLQKRLELEEQAVTYNDRLEELQKVGCVIKDLDHGIVDFYGLKDGRLIFLCWRMGESAISFWHEIDAGMVGRRPVSEL